MKKDIFIGFDLDETLISSRDLGLSNESYIDADFNISEFGLLKYSVYERPNARLLLNYIDKNYNLFFYTRSGSTYAFEIIKNLGFENNKIFSASSIDKESVDTIYEGFKRFEVKRLDKIAKKLGTTIDKIIFFDDIRNSNEIRPVERVVKVPEYNGSDFDNVLSILLKNINESYNLSDKDFFKKILSIEESDLINKDVDLKVKRNKKTEP